MRSIHPFRVVFEEKTVAVNVNSNVLGVDVAVVTPAKRYRVVYIG